MIQLQLPEGDESVEVADADIDTESDTIVQYDLINDLLGE